MLGCLSRVFLLCVAVLCGRVKSGSSLSVCCCFLCFSCVVGFFAIFAKLVRLLFRRSHPNFFGMRLPGPLKKIRSLRVRIECDG